MHQIDTERNQMVVLLRLESVVKTAESLAIEVVFSSVLLDTRHFTLSLKNNLRTLAKHSLAFDVIWMNIIRNFLFWVRHHPVEGLNPILIVLPEIRHEVISVLIQLIVISPAIIYEHS